MGGEGLTERRVHFQAIVCVARRRDRSVGSAGVDGDSVGWLAVGVCGAWPFFVQPAVDLVDSHTRELTAEYLHLPLDAELSDADVQSWLEYKGLLRTISIRRSCPGSQSLSCGLNHHVQYVGCHRSHIECCTQKCFEVIAFGKERLIFVANVSEESLVGPARYLLPKYSTGLIHWIFSRSLRQSDVRI